MKNKLLETLVARAWEVQFKYNKDGTIRSVKLELREGCTMGPSYVDGTMKRLLEFSKTAKGCGL